VTAAKIAELNDRLRQHGTGNGRVMVTRSIRDLGPEFELAALLKVRGFDAFTADNNPHGERDYGSFDLKGRRVLWKIEYYDPSLRIPTMVTPRTDAWRPPIPIDGDQGGVRAPLDEVGHLSVVA
jgi:uncharacterized protein DUF3768